MVLLHEEHYFDIHTALMLGAAVVLVVAAIHALWCIYVFRSSRAAKLTAHWHSAMIDNTYQTSFQLELYYHELIYMRKRILELTPLSLRSATAQEKGGGHKSTQVDKLTKEEGGQARVLEFKHRPRTVCRTRVPGDKAGQSNKNNNTDPLLGEWSPSVVT
jgi:hypothetical protein